MYFVGALLVSLFFCVSANNPITHNFINTIDENSAFADVKYRLPNNTEPLTYDITLVTNVHKGDFAFSGTVVIYLKVVEENTNTITLHARRSEIVSYELKKSGTKIPIVPTYDTTTEFLTFTASKTLDKDAEYELTIQYKSELRDDMGGFYKSHYENTKGETIWLATTQFEQTDARHAFPCYDEPGKRALFTVHITHGDNYTAISNTEVDKDLSSESVNGMKTTAFKQTPLMSTYLVAFIVSNFESVTATSEKTSIVQRVFTHKELIDQASYPLKDGVDILDAIAEYTGVPYGLSKMDQAAVPQFRAGAMENWGLVTYRESMLLFNDSIHLPSRQLSVTTTIAHEYAHQWFGNLVSPKWWTYTWLNEGFATIFEAIGTSMTHADFDIWTYFVSSKVQTVLRSDAQSNSRPMSTYAEDPASLSNLFDSISYAKAGSVIRMFMHALGESTFKKGLNYYLSNLTHKAAEEDDLFKYLDVAAKEDEALDASVNVKDLFGSWSNQKGFPVLKVTRNDNDTVTLEQEKYSVYKSDETETTQWWIPYNFATANNSAFDETSPCGWLSKTDQQILIKNGDCNQSWTDSDWLLLNKQQTGYYRVLYDDKNYDLLTKELNEGDINKFHPINRAQILDDLHSFVIYRNVSAENLCKAMTYLTKETSYAPWVVAKTAISEWNKNLQLSEKLKNFKKFVSGLVDPYYNALKLAENENDAMLDKLGRNIAVNLACEYGVETCLKETYAKFQEIISAASNEKSPHKNIRGVIFGNGIRSAKNEEIDTLWNYFFASKSDDERSEILSSLGNIQSEELINSTLNKATADLGDQKLSEEERQRIITVIASGSQAGASLAIDFVTNAIDTIEGKTGAGSVDTFVRSFASRILSDDMKTKFSALVDKAKASKLISEQTAVNVLKVIEDQIAWQKNSLKQFEEQFFQGKCSGASSLIALPALLFSLLLITRWNWL